MRLEDGDIVSLTVIFNDGFEAIGVVSSRDHRDYFCLDTRPSIEWHRERHSSGMGSHRAEKLI